MSSLKPNCLEPTQVNPWNKLTCFASRSQSTWLPFHKMTWGDKPQVAIWIKQPLHAAMVPYHGGPAQSTPHAWWTHVEGHYSLPLPFHYHFSVLGHIMFPKTEECRLAPPFPSLNQNIWPNLEGTFWEDLMDL
jgi:hypothetical protein